MSDTSSTIFLKNKSQVWQRTCKGREGKGKDGLNWWTAGQLLGPQDGPNSPPFLQQFWRRKGMTAVENWYIPLHPCMGPCQESPRPGSQPPALKKWGHQCKSTPHILPRVSETVFPSLKSLLWRVAQHIWVRLLVVNPLEDPLSLCWLHGESFKIKVLIWLAQISHLKLENVKSLSFLQDM